MHVLVTLTLLAIALLVSGSVHGARYSQTDSHQGVGFFESFFFEAIPDPTRGRVNYVNADVAARENLTFASGNHFILRSDFKKRLSAGGPGRDSVRLRSYKQYSTSVTIFSVRHMPQGCGTWPALWTVGNPDDWPNQGEIDIVEGVNDLGPNTATLHTNAGCTMPARRAQTGTATGNNCDVVATNNAGCSVKFDTGSFGPSFNSRGGGWFAMERTSSFIKIWFWSRSAEHVPFDVKNGATSVDTGDWGIPTAYFPSTSCSIGSKFGPHHIIINLTFCGEWAGLPDIYGAAGCPSTCVDFVNKNPSSFRNAYFDIQWLKIYE